MTIHSAKGLEFDTVFLPALDRKMPANDKPLLAWMEQPLTNGDAALLLSAIHATGNDKDQIYEFIQAQQKTKLHFETDRLLYVAATRAKHRLLLTYQTESMDADTKTEAGSFLAKLWPLIRHVSVFDQDKPSDNITDSPMNNAQQLKRLISSWSNPFTIDTNTSFALHQRFSNFKQRDNLPRVVGIITHKILQLITKHSVMWWTNQSPDSQSKYVEKLALRHDLDVHLNKSLVVDTISAIARVLTDERGQWILFPHRDSHAEFALSAVIDQQVQQLVVDRTFIDEHGCRWIIDYKTSVPNDADLGSFLKNESRRHKEQLNRYVEAFKLLGDVDVKCGLYFPLVPGWIEVG